MNKIFFLFIAILFCFSCNKNNDGSNPTPDPTPPPIQSATKFIFENFGSSNSNPNQILVAYKTTTLNVFSVNGAGIYSAEFHGLGGASMLQGSARHTVSSATLADWQIGTGDTLRIFKNGVKYIDYIGDQSDGINGGIFMTVNPGENESQVKTRINTFTSGSGDMKGLKLKTL